jgi:hypothetical protein
MPTLVACPNCKRKLRVPDDLVGRKVKCPGCQEPFTADAGGAETLALRPEKPREGRVADRPMPPEGRDEEERVRARPRPGGDEEDEDDEDDFEEEEPRKPLPPANWWRVRGAFSLLLASALTYVGAFLLYLGGSCILGLSVGMAAAKAGGGGPPPPDAMMSGIMVLVGLLLSAILIGFVLGLIGHFVALASPRAHGAWALAVAILVFTLVGLLLTIVPWALGALTGDLQGMMMGGMGNPMFAGMGGMPGVPQWVTTLNLILGLINNVLSFVGWFLVGFYVRAIARCVGEPSLAGSAKGWMILLGVFTTLAVVTGGVFFVVFKDLLANPQAQAQGPPPMGGGFFAFLGMGCLLGIVGVALMIWYIIMLAHARNAISSRAAAR